MKLLLTSYGWHYNKKIASAFLRLAGKPPKEIKIFLVSTDDKKNISRKWIRLTIAKIKKLGILEKHISVFSLNRKIKKNELTGFDVIYVCGGNTFLYLAGLRKTGLDSEIKKFLKKGGLYYGVSAGSVVAGPDVAFAAPFDDPNVVTLKNTKGLGLTDIAIVPHYNDKRYTRLIDMLGVMSKYRLTPITDKQAIEIVGRKKKIIR